MYYMRMYLCMSSCKYLFIIVIERVAALLLIIIDITWENTYEGVENGRAIKMRKNLPMRGQAWEMLCLELE